MLVVDAVDDDPVVPLPVRDGRQRQVVEPALRRPDRARREAELLGAARDPGQRRPVGRGVDGLADVGDADRVAEVAADHRQAGGAAVHLVELVDVRESADRALLRRHADVVRRFLLQLRLELDLFGRDGLQRRLRRQELLGEIERHVGDAAVVVLLDPLLQP